VKSLIRDEKGRALTIVIILLVGGLITFSVLAHMRTGLITGQVYEKEMHEYYAADAGVEDAIWKIRYAGFEGDQYCYPPEDDDPWFINNKRVEVCIDRAGMEPMDGGCEYFYDIFSTATSQDDSSTTIRARVTLNEETTGGWDDIEWDEFDEFGEEDFDDEGNYYGNVKTEQNVLVIVGGTIHGNVWATDGNVILKPGATITGGVKAEGTSGHQVELGEGAVIESDVCAQYIILKKGAKVVGTAYAECVDSGTLVALEEDAEIMVDAYSENGNVEVLKAGAKIYGDAYAANEVKVESGGWIGGTIYNGYEDWPGCPLGGGISTITGVDIDSWQIS